MNKPLVLLSRVERVFPGERSLTPRLLVSVHADANDAERIETHVREQLRRDTAPNLVYDLNQKHEEWASIPSFEREPAQYLLAFDGKRSIPGFASHLFREVQTPCGAIPVAYATVEEALQNRPKWVETIRESDNDIYQTTQYDCEVRKHGRAVLNATLLYRDESVDILEQVARETTLDELLERTRALFPSLSMEFKSLSETCYRRTVPLEFVKQEIRTYFDKI